MADPRIGLALGGGAARGLAHIEVLHGLDEVGIRPHRMAGTSIGALMAVGYASGLSAADMEDHARSVLANRLDAMRRLIGTGQGGVFDLISVNPLASPLLDGRQLVRLTLPQSVPARLEALEVPTTVVTTDFYAGQEVALTAGGIVDAVAASIAIPGVISAPDQSRVLIDGGCVNPVPISYVQEDCDIVIGVNVIGKPIPRGRIRPRTSEMMTGAFQLQQQTIARLHRTRYRCDIWVEPQVDRFRVHEFFRIEEIFAAAKPARDQFKRDLEAVLNRGVKSGS